MVKLASQRFLRAVVALCAASAATACAMPPSAVLITGSLTQPSTEQANTDTQPTIGIHGDLRRIAEGTLDQGRSVSQIAGDRMEGFYALGMPVGLDAELLVLDGVVYRGSTEHAGEVTTPDIEAAFLVHASVPSWIAVTVPDKVSSFEELEAFAVEQARAHGVGVDDGFPFQFEGDVSWLEWFVVGGMGNKRPNPQASFLRMRTLGGKDDRRIRAVGFHVPTALGIATSPNAPTHIHFVTDDDEEQFVGHLNGSIAIEAGGRIFLPG